MCGIFGFTTKRSNDVNIELLNACRDKLSYRGPNAAGNFQDRGLYLGFRRLAILDPTVEGNQPMTSADGRYTLVFNGEIYNFVELRAELEHSGEVFKGRSDTEVLLRLYVIYGISSINKLNGMFAFAVYDKVERTILLVRDRMGVKPLYYWMRGESFAFASEVVALRELPGFPTEIDQEALGLYFRLGMVPEWTSIYPGLFKLGPGKWIKFHLDSGEVDGPVSYWDLPPIAEDEGKSEQEWVDEIESLLLDATHIRLRSDVSLGVFLSGGIDSGLIAAAAAKQVKGLTSLSIGFAGEPEDETALALSTARHLGLNPITRNIDLKEGFEILPQIMAHFDEPFSDTSALPTSLICAEARKNFTVVLSGDAGDEVFGGYKNHVRAWQWRFMDRIPLAFRNGIGLILASISLSDSPLKRFFQRLRQPVGLFGMGGMVYPFMDCLDSCLKPEFNPNPERVVKLCQEHFQKWAGASSIDLAQRTDLRNYLLEDILIKVDRMSMRHSLEVRSPFLDYRLVELGLKVPSRLRTKNGCNKYLLRRLAERHLPEAVCSAPKSGFGIPLNHWLQDSSIAPALMATLKETPECHIDPFVKGGAERLWYLGQKNPALTSMVVRLLCYRWWCKCL